MKHSKNKIINKKKTEKDLGTSLKYSVQIDTLPRLTFKYTHAYDDPMNKLELKKCKNLVPEKIRVATYCNHSPQQTRPCSTN